MNDASVNLHRSFAALFVGNIIALFVSGLICILIGHSTNPDYFQQLREFKESQKTKVEKENKSDKKEEPKSDTNDKEKQEAAEKKSVEKPELPFGLTVLIIGIDLLCAFAGGWVAVQIAGFAKNNHGMLMALFIVVWKIQQLVGFVDNQMPAMLLMMEVLAVPIACIFGAAMAGGNDTFDEDEEVKEFDEEKDTESPD